MNNELWVPMGDKQPKDGQYIIGLGGNGSQWQEKYDKDEPWGNMVAWKPCPLKVYVAIYGREHGCGNRSYGEGIVVATNEEHALDLCMETNKNTERKFWNIEEVDISKPSCDAYASDNY